MGGGERVDVSPRGAPPSIHQLESRRLCIAAPPSLLRRSPSSVQVNVEAQSWPRGLRPKRHVFVVATSPFQQRRHKARSPSVVDHPWKPLFNAAAKRLQVEPATESSPPSPLSRSLLRTCGQHLASVLQLARLARRGCADPFRVCEVRGTTKRGAEHEDHGEEECCATLVDSLAQCTMACEQDICGRRFVMPSNSQFVLGDVFRLKGVARCLRTACFRLMVLDPPWPNKSAHRAHAYHTMSFKRLRSMSRLPVQSMLREGAVVAVWVTHDPKTWEVVQKHWFPAWGVRHACDWYWLKVTADGTCVYPLPPCRWHHASHVGANSVVAGSAGAATPVANGGADSQLPRTAEEALPSQHPGGSIHGKVAACAPTPCLTASADARKPWERLMLGVVLPRGGTSKSTQRPPSWASSPQAFAAPVTSHSVKPPVVDLLSPHLPPRLPGVTVDKLELFARRLRTGWLSIGDQCLLFQMRELFAQVGQEC